MDESQEQPTIHDRLDSIEAMFEKIMAGLHAVQPVANLIPGVGTIVNDIAAVGDVIEHVLDPAAMAAQRFSISTGDTSLDGRLMAIESVLEAASPLLKYLARQFGFTDANVHFVAPLSLAAETVSSQATLGDTAAAQADAVVANAG